MRILAVAWKILPPLTFAVAVFVVLARDGASPGDMATWFGSLGTVGALFAVLYQIGSDQKQRAEAARSEQATQIAAWPLNPMETSNRTTITFLNSSLEPVYNVVVGLVAIQGTAAPYNLEGLIDRPNFWTVLSILPPGKLLAVVNSKIAGTMYSRPGVELGFTDRSGRYWLRRSNGRLEELDKPPIKHLALPQPIDFVLPEPE